MTFIEAIGLGVVQGLTEFLPVSSTGHLILTRSLFGMHDGSALAFDALLHLATAAAVILYFRKDLGQLLQTGLRLLARMPVNKKEANLLYALLVGTVPAVVLGLSLESLMATAFRSPILVAGVLVLGSLIFMYAEWRYVGVKRATEMNLRKGFLIGCFQSLALIPGMSRSGITIVGGMLLGLTRSEAARFAFLLAVPVIFGAGMKKLLELLLGGGGEVAWSVVGVGALTAFFSGLAAIHLMLSFVRRHTLWPFIWYRLFLASFVAFIFFFG